MRLHEAAPKLIIQERLGDKVKVSSYWPVPELTRAGVALGRLHMVTTTDTSSPDKIAQQLLEDMQPLEMEATDNLLTAKILQAHQANKHHSTKFPFKIGDQVLISTKHQRQEYKSVDTQ